MKNITLTWKVVAKDNTSRVGAMYCFKSCEKNQN